MANASGQHLNAITLTRNAATETVNPKYAIPNTNGSTINGATMVAPMATAITAVRAKPAA
jgi:hypothetical protein